MSLPFAFERSPPFDRIAVAPGAWRYATAAFALAVVLAPFVFPIALLSAALGVGILWFHRDPDRSTEPTGPPVSPADGRVSVVRSEGERIRIGVFMNVDDVHVNRAPDGGIIDAVDRRPGGYRPAFSKESERNERVRIDCGSYEVILIAGWFARRIHPYVEPGDRLVRGERIGHVSFGSRADVLLPTEYGMADVSVAVGDRVRAGETPIVDPDTPEGRCSR